MGIHNYSYVLPFEKDFEDMKNLDYFVHHWADSFVYSTIYVILIFSGKAWMKDRHKYDLRPFLILWSAVLGVFSVVGFVRTLPELLTSIRILGLRGSLCSDVFVEGIAGFWSYMFTVSKLYEFGDTLFIILRKQKLIFLHWYHHILTMIYVWYCYSHRMGFSVFAMVMNFGVHAVMYNYYALKAMKVPVPKFVSMWITALQIIQMLIGCVMLYIGYTTALHDQACSTKKEIAIIGIAMYISYFVLFGNFFFKTYMSRPGKETIKQE